MRRTTVSLALAAAALGLASITAPPRSPLDEYEEILRNGGPRFAGYGNVPRPAAKRLMLGELQESAQPAGRPKKFRYNRRG